jgi:Tfp pilus assembly protein PilZ
MLVLSLDAKAENLCSYMPLLQEGLLFLLYVRAIGIKPMRKHGG